MSSVSISILSTRSEAEERYPFLDPENRKWVTQTIAPYDVVYTGQRPHAVDVLYAVVAHDFPAMKNDPIRRTSENNRLKSKLKKVRDVFTAWHIDTPEHWFPFIDERDDSHEFFTNINFLFSALRNHFLRKRLGELANQQAAKLEEIVDLQEENAFHRQKLQAIVNILRDDVSVPFRSEMLSFITTTPECFKPAQE